MCEFTHGTTPQMLLQLALVLLEDAGDSAGSVTAPSCETENAVCQACIDVNEALPYWNGAGCGHKR